MTSFVSFLRRWWKVVAGAVGAVGVLVVAVLAWGRFDRNVGTPADGVRAEQARRKIAELQGRRDEVMRQDEMDAATVASIDVELSENRRALEEIRSRAEVPDDDLEAEFARLGF